MFFRRKDDCFNLKGQLLLDQPIKLFWKQSLTENFCWTLVLYFSRQQLWKWAIFVEGCWVCFWEGIFVVREIYFLRISTKFSWQPWFLTKAETGFHRIECLWTLGVCWEAVVGYCQVCFDPEKGPKLFRKFWQTYTQTKSQTNKPVDKAQIVTETQTHKQTNTQTSS